MKILFLSRWFPYPINNGSKLRIYNLLRGLNQLHDVTLLSFADQPGVSPDAPEIAEICSKVNVIPWREFDPNTTRARLGIFSLTPRSIIDTFSSDMAQAITDTLDGEQYDLVIASQLQMAAYFPYFKNVPAIFEELEIGLFYDQAFSSTGKIRFRHALTWFKLRIYLSQLLDSFQACTVTSEQEQALAKQNFSQYDGRIVVIPNCLNMSEYKNVVVEKKSNTLVFTGPFKYHTNYDAMVWFVRDIFPYILGQMPDTQLIITGDHANRPLPSEKNIELVGYVDDIKSLIASCTVSLAPLLDGGGTRLKILEAMALGTPVVSTSKGAEGLEVANGEEILIANEPVDFANSVIRLLRDEQLHDKLAENAKTKVQKSYDWGEMSSTYEELVQSVSK